MHITVNQQLLITSTYVRSVTSHFLQIFHDGYSELLLPEDELTDSERNSEYNSGTC